MRRVFRGLLYAAVVLSAVIGSVGADAVHWVVEAWIVVGLGVLVVWLLRELGRWADREVQRHTARALERHADDAPLLPDNPADVTVAHDLAARWAKGMP